MVGLTPLTLTVKLPTNELTGAACVPKLRYAKRCIKRSEIASRFAPPLTSMAWRVAGARASNGANATSGNTEIDEFAGVTKSGAHR